MTKEQYEIWSEPIRKRKMGIKIISLADKMITYLVFISYPALLLYLAVSGNVRRLVFCTCIPAVSFLLVSFFRKKYSAPRPYEVLEIHPLIIKNTKGKSFPSRHVFSVFIIGMTFFSVLKPLGIVYMIFGVAMAYIRVVGGVHFPKDVAAGALIGIFFGIFYILI